MRTALILCLLLSACATASDKNWPSLARRPSEQVAAGLATAPAAAGAPATASAPVASAAVTVSAARIDQADRELTAIEGRWTRQRAAAEAAVNAARGAARQSDAWSNAELERSRLAKTGAQVDDARERLNGIAGDLAIAAARGADVSASLAATGKLIARADTLRAEHEKATAALAGK